MSGDGGSGHGKKKSLSALTEHSAGHSGGHDGEGNWLVSYADMMTLLVGFFVILNSFSVIDEEKFEGMKREVTKQFGGVYQEPYEQVTERIKKALQKLGLGEQFVIKSSTSGVDISFMGAVFFDSGSADIKDVGRNLMQVLMPIIKAEKTDFDITIEGHTDDVPISSRFPFRNNFELSSIRACRVLDVFSNAGFSKERLTAIGYGETRPVVPNRDKNGVALPANQSKNRRVVIKLTKHGGPAPTAAAVQQDAAQAAAANGEAQSAPQPEQTPEPTH